MRIFERSLQPLVACVLAACFLVVPAEAQRDYFTPEEVELVRDAQQIDRRIAVLVKAMDRRFAVLGIDVAPPADTKKMGGDWGPLPSGTRIELINDLVRIMQKAIDDIDNLAERPNSAVVDEPNTKKGETMSKLFPRAVRALAAAAARYRPALVKELENSARPDEIARLSKLIEMGDEVLAALEKLPSINK